MKNKQNSLGLFLAAVCGITMLGMVVVRACSSRIILPRFDASFLILLSLVALVFDHYVAHGSRRNFRLIPVYAALIFGLFPLAALLVRPPQALVLAVLGGVIFPLITWLFDSMVDRLSDGAGSKAAPLLGAFGLYLATQCLMGII